MNNESTLIKIAQAEDTFNLLHHIAWTDVIKPELLRRKESFGKILVDHLLGIPLAEGQTKEMIAGRIYGINEMIGLIEKILTQGKKALEELQSKGISL